MIKINLLQEGEGKRAKGGPRGLGRWWIAMWIAIGCAIAVAVVVTVKFWVPFKPDWALFKPKVSEVIPLKKVEPPREAEVAQVPGEQDRLLTETKLSGALYAEVLNQLTQTLPPFIWLVSISISGDEDFFIEGVGTSFARIKEFRERLERVPLFSEVTIFLVRKGELDGVPAFKFTMGGNILKEKMGEVEISRGKPLSSKGEVEGFLKQIRRMGVGSGLTVLWLDKGPTFPGPYFDGVVIRGGVKGHYPQVCKFMGWLASLDEAVNPVKLVVLPPLRRENLPLDEVRLALDLNVYVVKE